MSTDGMKHWGNTDGGATIVACAEKAMQGIPLTLNETAMILNASGKYQRKLSPSDVLAIERRAMVKVRIRWGSFN